MSKIWNLLKAYIIILLPLCLTIKGYAAGNEYFLVVPNCLLLKNLNYKIIEKTESLTLIKMTSAALDKFKIAKLKENHSCGNFINVTSSWKAYSSSKKGNAHSFLKRYLPKEHVNTFDNNYKIQYQKDVNNLLALVNPTQMWTNLSILSGYPDRFVNSDNGLGAATWIKQQIEAMAEAYGRDDIEVYFISTDGDYKQPSVVAKLGKDLTNSGIVIGAHLDTLDSVSENRPGADDDGSGTVTILEAARVLISSHYTFKKPIYFIWYAGEEEGLLGSQSVVQYVKRNNIAIDAVLQLDMTGYLFNNDPTIGLTDDDTDTTLTKFVADLITTYVKQPVGVTHCGYACSDHATWYLNGYRVAYPFESTGDNEDPYRHTSQDTMEKLSLSHLTNFAKLNIAFATELAEPNS